MFHLSLLLTHKEDNTVMLDTVCYCNRLASLAYILPRHPHDIEIIKVMFPDSNNHINPKQYQIHPGHLRAALLWLKTNNFLYTDVIIDENLLEQLQTTTYTPVELSAKSLPQMPDHNFTDLNAV